MNAWSNTELEYRNELHFAIERTLICCLRVFESHKKLLASSELYVAEWKGINPFYNKISCIVVL